jgi:large subunit ribosomal protein L21
VRAEFLPHRNLSGSPFESTRWVVSRERYEQEEVLPVVYAVVRAGGRQEKVEVGTIVTLDRIKADEAGNITLAPVLLVDGETITHDAAKLAKITVTAEVLGDLRGPKIVIQKFKNKTGYKKRQGHRQELTRVKVTAIG